MGKRDQKPVEPRGVVTRSAKAMSAAGVVAAVVAMLLINILAAKHYRRWDVTQTKLYTLSPATKQTLQALEQQVQIEILLASSDPLERSVRNLLEAYNSETTRLAVNYVDPDRYPAEFLAVQQKYGIVAGRTEDGRVVTDAAIVVGSRDKHWFITSDDLVDYGGDDGKMRSKLEQALTAAIRSVLGGERMRICFTAGHGEFSIDDHSAQGLGELRDRLAKNNYDTLAVDLSQPDLQKPFDTCNVLIIAGPGMPFSAEQATAIAERMRQGMSGLFLLNPMLDPDSRKHFNTGLEHVARMFGIGLANDYIFEQDPAYTLPRGSGEILFPKLAPHATTTGLVEAASAGLRIVMMRSRSLTSIAGELQPIAIMSTSDEAFGMRDFFAWVQQGGEPKRTAEDAKGPLAVGMASELKVEGQINPARLVVLGSANPVFNQNWRDPSLRGNAVLVGNIVSWIAARPPILDVPARETVSSNLRITEESLDEILRYVLVFMPMAAALLGLAVYLRRRSTREKPVTKATRKAS